MVHSRESPWQKPCCNIPTHLDGIITDAVAKQNIDVEEVSEKCRKIGWTVDNRL